MQPLPFPPKHPVDRGWAWMVCLGSFTLNFLVYGALRSMGILFIDIVIKYKASPGLASLTLAILAGGFAIFSPIGNAIGTMSSMRVACLFGSVMMFLGMFLTYFASNIGLVALFLGMFTGIGYGFTFGPCMVVVSQYFEKRRSLATGLAASGGSVGTLLVPLFIGSASKEFGFDGMLLIFSAIILHAIPAAMLLRPLTFYSRSKAISAQLPEKMEKSVSEKCNTIEARKSMIYELRGSRIYEVSKETLLNLWAEEEKKANLPSKSAPAMAPSGGVVPRPKITPGLALRMFCQKICDRELFRHWGFIAFFLGVTVGNAGSLNCCLLLPSYGFELWRNKDQAALLIVIYGIADLVGRLGGGWFGDLGLVRKPYISSFSFIIAGTATLVVPFFRSFIIMSIYTAILGFLGGVYVAQMVVILAEMMGPLTPSGLGLTMLIMGLVIIPLPPFLTTVSKAGGTIAVAIRITGFLIMTGGILFGTIPFLTDLTNKKRKAKELKMESEFKTPEQVRTI